MNDNSENIRNDKDEKVVNNSIKSITKKLLGHKMQYTKEEIEDLPNPDREENREDKECEDTLSH